jgi:cytidylate kinase
MAVITISRQFGAGGITLGKMIAESMGYSFADSDILQRVAKEANVSTHWVESFEKGGRQQAFQIDFQHGFQALAGSGAR